MQGEKQRLMATKLSKMTEEIKKAVRSRRLAWLRPSRFLRLPRTRRTRRALRWPAGFELGGSSAESRRLGARQRRARTPERSAAPACRYAACTPALLCAPSRNAFLVERLLGRSASQSIIHSCAAVRHATIRFDSAEKVLLRKLKFVTVNSQNNPPRTVPVGKRSYPHVPSKIAFAGKSPAQPQAQVRPHSAHETSSSHAHVEGGKVTASGEPDMEKWLGVGADVGASGESNKLNAIVVVLRSKLMEVCPTP